MNLFGKEFKFNNNEIYHAGNKPTASEIGAAAASHNHFAKHSTGGDLMQIGTAGNTGYSGVEINRVLSSTQYTTKVGVNSVPAGPASGLELIKTGTTVGGIYCTENLVIPFNGSTSLGDSSYSFLSGYFKNELYANTLKGGSNLVMGTGSSDCYINNKAANTYIQIKNDGTLDFTGRVFLTSYTPSSNQSSFVIATSKDGNGAGDGNTHLSYNSSSWGGYTHYFRGQGPMIVDNQKSLHISKDWFRLGGKYIYVRSNTPSNGLQTGDVWIQI